MPFNKTEPRQKGEFVKTSYLTLTPGNHIVRLLEKDIDPIYVHYVLGKYTVKCLGEECPICTNNKKIIFEKPETFRDEKGYYPASKRYITNAFDRTLVKICPQCQTEVKAIDNKHVAACPNCNTIIMNEKSVPSNKVKLLTCGVTLANQLNSVEETVTDGDGNVIGLTNFDIILAVQGSGKSKTITPIPASNQNDKVEVPADALYDKSNAVITLTPEEITELLRGVSLKDIYAVRRGTAQKVATENPTDVVVEAELAQSAEDIVKELYGDK